MKNLVVVAHPDDEILGFGGTGKILIESGDSVQPLILSGQVDARTLRPNDDELLADIQSANKLVNFNYPQLGNFPNIQFNSIPHIKLVQFIESAIEKYQPDRIFTHNPSDLNDDHRQVSYACAVAARLFQRREGVNPLSSLYYMEIPSATDWAFPQAQLSFTSNVYFDITHSIDLKIEALNCYRNVIRDAPHPRSEQMIKSLASYRGGQSGFMYAEAFQLAFQRNL
jgi:N-acetylglucosamine malate deacetylase 1